jgi:hypothetical protein
MKQEHRLVAEIYRFLAPFIDASENIYLCLDGQAARTGVAAGHFSDPDVPDMWFTLVGAAQPFRLEAKILDGNAATLMSSQVRAWRSNGSSNYSPDAWVAASRKFDKFFFWPHSAFTSQLDKCSATQSSHKLATPKDKLMFSSLPELSLHILRVSPNNSFKPTPHRGVGHVPALR